MIFLTTPSTFKFKRLFSFGEFIFPFNKTNLSRSFKESAQKEWANEVSKYVEKTTQTISEIQKVLKIVALGIDYRKYSKYKSIVQPMTIHFSVDGKTHQTVILGEIILEREDLDFCIDFIVESALKLQEFDF